MELSRDRNKRADGPPAERPLQRADPGEAVPVDWLVDAHFDGSAEARRLADLVRAGDSELLLQLQLESYTGPVWEVFCDVVVRYAVTVLRSWLRRGLMAQRLAEKRLRGRPRDLGQIPDPEAEELAGETVAVALISFRDKVLKANRWDPRKGASLRTYFIGHCLARFIDVWAAREAERKRSPWEPLPDDADQRLTCDGPERQVVIEEEISEGLGDLDERTATVVRLYAQGYRHAEIAERIGNGTTAKAVERIWARHRERQRKGA